MAWNNLQEFELGELVPLTWINGVVQNLNFLLSLVATGAVMDYAGATAPDGWLLCDGSPVSRATYADLFAAIGTTYGAGDGSTTFNLPDLRGRTTAGKDDMGGTSGNRITAAWADTLGGSGGAESHTLQMTELPSGDGGVARLGNPRRRYNGGTGVAAESNTTQGWVDNTDLSGAGQAHANIQPTMALNKIIKI